MRAPSPENDGVRTEVVAVLFRDIDVVEDVVKELLEVLSDEVLVDEVLDDELVGNELIELELEDIVVLVGVGLITAPLWTIVEEAGTAAIPLQKSRNCANAGST